MSTLAFLFTNNSGVDPTAVSIGFLPGPPPVDGKAIPFSIINLDDSTPIKALNDVEAYPSTENWYSLDTLQKGVGIRSFSGRIYVCYGQPWELQYAGYEPGQAVTDKNFFLRYDKMEITFRGDVYDAANLTSIDYWSIPMSLTSLKAGSVVQQSRGLLPGQTTQDVFNNLSKLTTPPVSGLPSIGGVDGDPLPALIPGKYQQYPGGPMPGSNFARIIGPSTYPQALPAPGGRPVMPYDLFQDYLTYLLQAFGPDTQKGTVVPNLGNGVIANISGEFVGVGPNVPPSGPRSKQTYKLAATIDSELNITLSGTVSGVPGETTMVYQKNDVINPSGIYGGNAQFYLNGAEKPMTPPNDVYGWVGGDLFSGMNIGAVGSKATDSNGSMVGGLESHEWFTLPVSSFFAKMQPDKPYYNQWAATLAQLSEAYNYAYTDRFAPVLVSLNPDKVDTLKLVLEDGAVTMTALS